MMQTALGDGVGHALMGGRQRILDDDRAPALADVDSPGGAVHATAGQDHRDGTGGRLRRKALQEGVDGVGFRPSLPTFGWARVKTLVFQGQDGGGRGQMDSAGLGVGVTRGRLDRHR